LTKKEDENEESEKELIDRRARTPASTKYPLGGTSQYKDSGASLTEEEIAHCHRCGMPIQGDNYFLCSVCSNTLHPKCVFTYNGRSYCQDHITDLNIPNLSKTSSVLDSEILVCIFNKVNDTGTMSKLARVPERQVLIAISDLSSYGYIERKSVMLLFRAYELTASGMEAMPIMYEINRQKNAMKQFILDLKEYTAKNGKDYSSPDFREEMKEEVPVLEP